MDKDGVFLTTAVLPLIIKYTVVALHQGGILWLTLEMGMGLGQGIIVGEILLHAQ